MNGNRQRVLLLVILAGALGLRLACGRLVAKQVRANAGSHTGRFLFPDSRQFDAGARNLLARGSYIDGQHRRAWRTPAYSLLLAGLYRLGGDSPTCARIFTNLLDVLNVLLACIAARMFFDHRAGLPAAAMTACYPAFVYFSNLVLADTLAVTSLLLVSIAYAAATRGHARTGCVRYALCGLALAFAAMVKASLGLLWLPMAGLLVLAGTADRLKRATTRTALPCLLLGLLLGLAPWWLRNYRVFSCFVPLSTMGGFTLFESNNPAADGGPNNDRATFPASWRQAMQRLQTCADARTQARLELAADRLLRRAAGSWIREHPQRFLRLVPVRIARTWNPVPNWSGARHWIYRLACLGSYLPVMLLALYALWTGRRQWPRLCALVVPALYLTAVHAVFMGSLRYRLPAMACIIVLAAGGASQLLFRAPGTDARNRLPAAASD